MRLFFILFSLPLFLSAQPYALKKLRHSKYFQGNQKHIHYFEGWYFKMVSADESAVYAVIPGIALGDAETDGHAFIQLIDGQTGATRYWSYPLSDFRFSRKDFAVQVGPNYFSDKKISLQLPGELEGEVRFRDPARYPARLHAPGIMGWYRFMPFMQTYHGVVSLNHGLEGSLQIEGQRVDFAEGKGYIEKDWGESFPSSWIWMQSNHFEQEGVSFMMSVADIPWLGKSFTGFLGFLLVDGQVFRFATYTGAKLEAVALGENEVSLRIRERKWSLEVRASRSQLGILAAPVQGVMERRIAESLDARIELLLKDRKGKVLFRGAGSSAGLEMVGEVQDLIHRLNLD
jgi:tocopherol cyclase